MWGRKYPEQMQSGGRASVSYTLSPAMCFHRDLKDCRAFAEMAAVAGLLERDGLKPNPFHVEPVAAASVHDHLALNCTSNLLMFL